MPANWWESWGEDNRSDDEIIEDVQPMLASMTGQKSEAPLHHVGKESRRCAAKRWCISDDKRLELKQLCGLWKDSSRATYQVTLECVGELSCNVEQTSVDGTTKLLPGIIKMSEEGEVVWGSASRLVLDKASCTPTIATWLPKRVGGRGARIAWKRLKHDCSSDVEEASQFSQEAASTTDEADDTASTTTSSDSVGGLSPCNMERKLAWADFDDDSDEVAWLRWRQKKSPLPTVAVRTERLRCSHGFTN